MLMDRMGKSGKPFCSDASWSLSVAYFPQVVGSCLSETGLLWSFTRRDQSESLWPAPGQKWEKHERLYLRGGGSGFSDLPVTVGMSLESKMKHAW